MAPHLPKARVTATAFVAVMLLALVVPPINTETSS